MLENLDPLLLSRIQFAFTISFHIIFPAFTIGLASWLVVVEALYLKTGHPIYKEIYKFWVKIFAVAFGMGVVSGIVISYQIGTNWSGFSDKLANVLGPLLAYEVLTAFFLEASFLGIMLFGWEKVSNKMHFFATLVVAIGTLLSALWILSANSWMHTPRGYEIREGVFYAKDWWEVFFNPSFPFRFVHMVTGAYLTTAFVVGGVGAWYLWRNKFIQHARIMFFMAMLMAVFVAPLQLLFGDLHSLNTLQHQPAKIAAIEGIWETTKGAPFTVLGLPDNDQEATHYALEIPKLGSLLLTHSLQGEIRGLKSWDKEKRPPVFVVFWAFRIMVAIGLLMIITGIIAAILFVKRKLFNTRWFQVWCMGLTPLGFVAILSGWFVTEIGRQPYVAYGLLTTKEMVSPVQGSLVAISLATFIGVYTFLFGVGIFYILALIKKGPIVGKWHETYGQHGVRHPVTIDEIFLSKKELHHA